MQHSNNSKPLLPSIKFLLDPNELGGVTGHGSSAPSSPQNPAEANQYPREYHHGPQQHAQHYPFPAGPGGMHKEPPTRLDNPRGPAPMHPQQYHPAASPAANLPVDMQSLSISGVPKYNPYEQQQQQQQQQDSRYAASPFGVRHSMEIPAASPGYGQGPYGNSVPNLREPGHFHFPPHPHARPANLSPPQGHLFPGRPRPQHSHSRSLSDFTHPYASSPPRDPTYHLTTAHTHRRAASANTIDFLLQQPAPWASPNDSPRIPSPIPSSTTSANATAPTSPIDDNDYDELSEERSPSERSASPDGSSGGSGNPNGAQNRYQCPFCSKRFSRPSSLRIHTYSHTGEKPFVCTEDGCGRKFSVQSNMRRHLRVHRLGRAVKKVRYDGEVEGVKMVGSGANSPGEAPAAGASGLHRSGTI